MAAEVLFSGTNVVFDCDGNFVFCDTTAENRLCCYNCDDGTDESHYQVLVPCGNLVIKFTDVANGPDCVVCTDWNDTNGFEIPKSAGTCSSWAEIFDNDSTDPCVTEYTSRWNIQITLHCCYNSSTDKIELWAWINMYENFTGYWAASWALLLDAQDLVDGECYYYDWSDPSDTATHGNFGYISDGNDTTTCTAVASYFRDICDWTGSTPTLENA